jgi:hypothetical protein
MAHTISTGAADRHRVIPDVHPEMLTADLRKPEGDTWRVDIGRTVQRSMTLLGWSLKEFAGAVGRDPRQCARWMDGTERPQLDVIFAVRDLRRVFVIAVSELAGAEVEIETTIRIRRSA